MPVEVLRRTVNLIRSGYPSLAFDCHDYEALYERMTHDKKNEGGRIRFALLERVGDIRIDQEHSGFADMKGLVEHLLLSLGIVRPQFQRTGEHPYLSPAVSISVHDSIAGRLGRIRDDLANTCLARNEIWYADLDLDLLMGMCGQPAFRPIPRFPVIRRDMTLAVPSHLAIGAIMDSVREFSEPLLEDVFLVDVYAPDGQDERNLSFRFVYRHPERTLKDKEVDKANSRLGQYLTERLPVRFP